MNELSTAAAVVVGVDGSEASVNALRWAIAEAVGRNVALRIVHVTGVDEAPVGASRPGPEDAERTLHAASAVVKAAGVPVSVETDLVWGPVSAALIDESRTAAVVCVGSVGIGASAGELLGATAAALTENAHCPVAIIRSAPHRSVGGVDWIVVGIDDHPDNDTVIECTLDEARLRGAPVLAVGVWAEDLDETSFDELASRMATWTQRYPDVHIHSVVTRGCIGRFLADRTDESWQLAVLSRHDVDQIAFLVWPQDQLTDRRRDCSVMVVR
jgi:nucleotide-binding universal stress UspA family protein